MSPAAYPSLRIATDVAFVVNATDSALALYLVPNQLHISGGGVAVPHSVSDLHFYQLGLCKTSRAAPPTANTITSPARCDRPCPSEPTIVNPTS